jgi:hypothetical protein
MIMLYIKEVASMDALAALFRSISKGRYGCWSFEKSKNFQAIASLNDLL